MMSTAKKYTYWNNPAVKMNRYTAYSSYTARNIRNVIHSQSPPLSPRSICPVQYINMKMERNERTRCCFNFAIAKNLLNTAAAHTAAICLALNVNVPALPVVAAERPAATLPTPILDADHALTEETWGLVERYFISPDYNGVDWAQVHTQLQESPYRSRPAVYTALRKALKSLGDPYTRLLTPTEMLALQKFDISGVGLLLTAGTGDTIVVATQPPEGTPARAAGIERGDVLLEVNGKPIDGITAFEIAQLMQGDEGETMDVTFRQAGQVSLKRHFISNNDNNKDTGIPHFVAEDGTGHIQLNEFTASARGDVTRAVQDLTKQGAKAFVLDMRGNPGGVFQGALEIAGIFEGDGVPVAKVSGRNSVQNGEEEKFASTLIGAVPASTEIPLAILVDKHTASASEVLAGGLQDSCRAAVLGNERSYGKGVIQGVFGLSDGSGLVLTVAQYVTPNGTQIHGKGLLPDLPIHQDIADKLLGVIGVTRPPIVDFEAVNSVTAACKSGL